MKPVNRVGLLLFLVAARAEAQQAGWPFVNIILSTSQSRTFAAATLSDGQLDLTCSVTANNFLAAYDASGFPYQSSDSQTNAGQAQASVYFQFNPALCYTSLGNARFRWNDPPIGPLEFSAPGPTREMNCPPPAGGGSCGGQGNEGTGGHDYQDPGQCDPGEPCCSSPLILNLDGQGFDLGCPEDPVAFDINADARPEKITWTGRGSRDGFLVLDRNRSGLIENGAELFGNHTPLPDGTLAPNGFAAFAAYDEPANGGNGDGVIDCRDSIFSRLRVWVDQNHNGRTDDEELHTLSDLNIIRIELGYRESRRRDHFGNLLRYWGHAVVTDERHREKTVDICDVFFLNVP